MESSDLSAAGKTDLTKTNLTGMTKYHMKWFKFSKVHCNYIDKINRNFFWNNNSIKDNRPSNKFHTFAWKKFVDQSAKAI